ncbi:tRNA modification GTPase [Chryseobacterium gambrini]|uniref:tRNA modification GTPase n=1 Tax=Chryseobacterium gambrini TaxID=373672 RepID=A0AAJ1R786_9FLAO|nr:MULTISPECIES: tRNA modification GTPase [Chryseobacterium]MDN4014305.1 tRNA modification GTPase [Chryseobacterium gambrini]MDN4028244.1 tRNA modification GTPase [Chryseobacterium gambrini]QWA39951.1 tRNA modification GTPase [Chryseobacterium sp. ZHDP1]
MKKICLFTGLISAAFFNAQIKFEKGYFVNNSGQRSEVLIKNLDWKNNPTEFEYKTDETSAEIKKESIKNIQEFGIDNEQKYIRKTVMVDLSSDQLQSMSYEKKANFAEKTVFLKYVVEGKADLLYYENEDLERFFFSVNDSEVKQLVYKPYYIENSLIAYNEEYKKQILDNLNCGVDLTDVNKLNYKPKDLIKVFLKYNECSNSSAVNYNQNYEKRDLFNLTIRPGMNFSSFEMVNDYYSGSGNAKFDNKISFRIGLEAEFILPFNKNKWAVFAEPTYQYYKTEKQSVVYEGQPFETTSIRNIDYKSIEIPLGIRHYFFLNDKSKIFINAAYVFDIEMGSNIRYDYNNLKIFSGNNFVFGVGFKYNDKFQVEFRTSTNRNLMQDYLNWTSKYQTSSVILGYTLF